MRFLGAVLATALLVSALATAAMQAAVASGGHEPGAPAARHGAAPCPHAAQASGATAEAAPADPGSADPGRSGCIDACCPACMPLRVSSANGPCEGAGFVAARPAGQARALDPGLIDPPPRAA